MEEGLKLALLWTLEVTVMESDYCVALGFVKIGNTNNSVYDFKILYI
jgi:hypothetical protein